MWIFFIHVILIYVCVHIKDTTIDDANNEGKLYVHLIIICKTQILKCKKKLNLIHYKINLKKVWQINSS